MAMSGKCCSLDARMPGSSNYHRNMNFFWAPLPSIYYKLLLLIVQWQAWDQQAGIFVIKSASAWYSTKISK
jgi:hypothetical protein